MSERGRPVIAAVLQQLEDLKELDRSEGIADQIVEAFDMTFGPFDDFGSGIFGPGEEPDEPRQRAAFSRLTIGSFAASQPPSVYYLSNPHKEPREPHGPYLVPNESGHWGPAQPCPVISTPGSNYPAARQFWNEQMGVPWVPNESGQYKACERLGLPGACDCEFQLGPGVCALRKSG